MPLSILADIRGGCRLQVSGSLEVKRMTHGRGKMALLIGEEKADVTTEVGGADGHDIVEGDHTVDRKAISRADGEFGRQPFGAGSDRCNGHAEHGPAYPLASENEHWA